MVGGRLEGKADPRLLNISLIVIMMTIDGHCNNQVITLMITEIKENPTLAFLLSVSEPHASAPPPPIASAFQ